MASNCYIHNIDCIPIGIDEGHELFAVYVYSVGNLFDVFNQLSAIRIPQYVWGKRVLSLGIEPGCNDKYCDEKADF